MDITRWSTPKSDWLYSLQPKMEKLYTVGKNETGSWLWLRSWTPYCQTQTEIEVGKTITPFRYDLNQIPYDYTVEVTNRFKGLDLIECLKNYGRRFVTLCKRQWSRLFPRKHTGHSKHPLPTIQEKTLQMDITRLPTWKSDWLYSLQAKMEKFYTVSKNKAGSWLWLISETPYCQI